MDIGVYVLHVALVSTCLGMSYEGYQAYHVAAPINMDQVRKLTSITNGATHSRKVQLMDDAPQVGQSVGLIVAPDMVNGLRSKLRSAKLDFSVVEHDVGKRLKEQKERNHQLRTQFPGDASRYFMNWTEQVGYVKSLTEGSNRAQYTYIGTSFQGRKIPLISINGERADLPGVWIDAGIHAREWMAHATAIYIVQQILYGNNKKAKELRKKYRIYIAPNLNPDGYVFSWEQDRYWRKSRQPNAGSECVGVDLNRNFDTNFANCGVSPDPCSDLYPGSEPNSEPETREVVNEIRRINDESGLSMYVNLHAYGQLWLIPWGSSFIKPDDYTELRRVARKAVRAIRKRHKHTFIAGTPPDLIYCAAGGVMDWAKNDGTLPGDGAGIKYAYSPELRPQLYCCDDFFLGFSPDPSKIQNSGQEIFAGLHAAITAMRPGRG